MAVAAAVVPVRVLMMWLILYKVVRAGLVVAVVVAELINRVLRPREAAILLAVAAVAVVGPLTALVHRVEVIQGISVEDPEARALITMDQAMVAEVAVAEAVLAALSL